MLIDPQVIGIYLAMVLFGLFAYAYIIPYFVARKVRALMGTGLADGLLQDVMKKQVPVILQGAKDWAKSDAGRAEINAFLVGELPSIMNATVTLEDGTTKPILEYISGVVGTQVMTMVEMRFLNFKQQVGRQIESAAGPIAAVPEIIHAIVPKKYHGAADALMQHAVGKYLQTHGQPDNTPSAFSLTGK